MERKIKFRAQRKYSEEWNYFDLQEYLASDEKPLPDILQYLHRNICQFTGLTDKNGKEIYEGDILNHETKEECQNNYLNPADVIYSENDFRFSLRCLKGEDHGLPLNWGGYVSLEIIGNIYENPELLKPKTL